MSHSIKGTKRNKCFRYVAIDGKVCHRFEDKGTSPHTGNAWTKRVLNKAARRAVKSMIETEAA